MVTSHDVARLAGVSQPTVSRALRDSPKVSDETKLRVRRAARTLGYVISETGRALSSGRSRRVGLLLTDLENEFYPYVIAPMHRELESLGYQLVLHTESSDSDRVVEHVISHGLDGVLLATTTRDSGMPLRLADRGVPFVYFNRTTESVEADSATVDPSTGMRGVAETLTDLGHRRIAAIFGPRNTSTGEAREDALREALESRGVTIPLRLTHHGPFDFATGQAGARKVLAGSPTPTAIVCANDVVALGVLNTVQEFDIEVPRDLSVIGFDDLPLASWPLVELATVAFDLDAMARRATRLLVARIEGDRDAPFDHPTFPSRLIRRRTLAPAPSG